MIIRTLGRVALRAEAAATPPRRSGAGVCGNVFALLAVLALAACSSPPPAAESAPPSNSRATGATPPASARARDAFVVLSGGGTPLSNQYSQYVQARAMATFLAERYPAEATWIFFGVGNRTDEPVQLADVHRQIERDGHFVDTWLPGALPRNRPATRASFLKALREEILPTVRDGGVLYLFVGDHGELTRGESGESAITLWQLKPNRRQAGAWITDETDILRVSELRETLAQGLGRGRVVFCMTQCHSGGFHHLAVPREMTPPPAWFTLIPDWAKRRQGSPAIAVAGFTATDEASPAAGCDPAPDPELWAGYERFGPEALTGLDLLRDRAPLPPRLSFAEAHEAAVLVDHTIDKPRSTAEQYLEGWATLIETRLARALGVTDKTRQAIAAYQRAVGAGIQPTQNADLLARQDQFRRFTERMVEQSMDTRDLLLRGSREQLEGAMKGAGTRQAEGRPGGGRRGAATEARRLWTETLRPAWKAALARAQPSDPLPSGYALEFENHLLQLEEGGRDFMVRRSADEALLNEIYWKSGYSHPASMNRAKAEAVARWGADRRLQILTWAEASPDAALRNAAGKIAIAAGLTEAETHATDGSPPKMTRRTAAARALFYRRVLAAWEFLLTMDDPAALETLRALLALERTPLPPPRVTGGV
ncbi:MAG: hypothetical protein RIQ93_1834 [Verrucomicrobiota bacterium]|jgi:hypothetical protein